MRCFNENLLRFPAKALEIARNEIREYNRRVINLQLEQQIKMARRREVASDILNQQDDLRKSQAMVTDLNTTGKNAEAELIKQRIEGLNVFVFNIRLKA